MGSMKNLDFQTQHLPGTSSLTPQTNYSEAAALMMVAAAAAALGVFGVTRLVYSARYMINNKTPATVETKPLLHPNVRSQFYKSKSSTTVLDPQKLEEGLYESYKSEIDVEETKRSESGVRKRRRANG